MEEIPEKESTHVASDEVSTQFKTLINNDDINHKISCMYSLSLGRQQDSNAILSHFNDYAECCFAQILMVYFDRINLVSVLIFICLLNKFDLGHFSKMTLYFRAFFQFSLTKIVGKLIYISYGKFFVVVNNRIESLTLLFLQK
ncbi:hypothetical protein MKW94_011105 [Papaver nudicaule]|uniref:Uncharacterized protein n=1 Tax=Papaver nudicaule TaxID=74823 RepID=A0AA41W2I4_PAPNU|nr:hypothetical protein [Papaver nudicaule]